MFKSYLLDIILQIQNCQHAEKKNFQFLYIQKSISKKGVSGSL